MTSFSTSSKSDLFRKDPCCWNRSGPRILFSEWCQQCTPNLPRMMSHDATRAALRKRSVFVRCSGVVSDTSEVGFGFHMRVSRSWYLFFFFSIWPFSPIFSEAQRSCEDIIMQHSLCIPSRFNQNCRYKTTCRSQADLHGNIEIHLQLTSTWELHNAIHVGVAALPGGSRLWHRFYK